MFEELELLATRFRDRKITSLFDADRFDQFSIASGELFMDYSKTNVDDEVCNALLHLAQARGVFEKRDAMFRGDKINVTEDRAVLHTALRAPRDAQIDVNGANVVPGIHAVLDAMRVFAEGIRGGSIAASNGQPFTDVVNIGIGGSDLGPVMATLALAPYADGPRTHFVSNVDGAHISDVLAPLDPNTTLVIVASKTFTTIETLTNARAALKWLDGVSDVSQHLAAISTALDKTGEFGILPERVFGFEDWVGGRYSMWGPIGLSIMLAIGGDDFDRFLAGAYDMDQHFLTASGKDNLPLMLGLIGIWHRNLMGYSTRAVLPYDQRLSRLPAYLQQLDMESNGKSVTVDGDDVATTGPVVWGEPGTNGQHAFYQLIHQGTDVIPCEFLIAREAHEPELAYQHKLLKANCLAQSRALLIGRDLDAARAIVEAKGFKGDEAERQAKQRVFKGNRPSITFTYDKLTPYVLGQLIAAYEHRVFVEGAIWGINSFDQWGVELGKELALALEPAFDGDTVGDDIDGSTAGLLGRLR